VKSSQVKSSGIGSGQGNSRQMEWDQVRSSKGKGKDKSSQVKSNEKMWTFGHLSVWTGLKGHVHMCMCICVYVYVYMYMCMYMTRGHDGLVQLTYID
jgi:hypothetical protein